MDEDQAHGIVLFDGVCNLCNASVSFIIDRDPHGYFRFASLQSDAGAALLRRHGRRPGIGVPPGKLESVILVERGRLYSQSDAALRISRRLSGAWPLVSGLVIVPRPLRDLVYRWIAANRYRWFGKSETCRVPTPDLRARFLDG